MGSLPIAQWQDALDRMESTLLAATRTLDRAEERWELAAAPSAGDGEPLPAFDRIDARLQEWDARLRAAEQLTTSVDHDLAERAAEIARRRALLAEWQELLERKEHTS